MNPLIVRRAVPAVLIVVVVVVVVVGAWWGLRADRSDPAAADVPLAASSGGDASAPPEQVGRASGEVADATLGAGAREDWPPLPAPGVPVAEMFDELSERAARGDAGAACRLGVELQRCAVAGWSQVAAADIERDVARRASTPEAAVAAIARMQSVADRFSAGCEGLAPEQLDRAFEWQRQAALARPGLRPWFALNPALDRMNFLADIERWAEYRRLALPWLEEAAGQGDPSAVIALARVFGDHRRNSPPFPPFRIRDDERFVVYAELMERYGVGVDVVRRAAEEARERLPPALELRAQEQVDRLHRRDVPPVDAATASRALGNSLQGTADPAACE